MTYIFEANQQVQTEALQRILFGRPKPWELRRINRNQRSWSFMIWVCLKIGYIPNYSHLIGIGHLWYNCASMTPSGSFSRQHARRRQFSKAGAQWSEWCSLWGPNETTSARQNSLKLIIDSMQFLGNKGTRGRIVEETKTWSARTNYNANWQHIKLHHTMKKCCCEALLSTWRASVQEPCGYGWHRSSCRL